ncbi:4'-phosphopantetheinyl transferase family protein [Streptomyces sp. NPDC019531]|uniref:4'-phosphopantetheinyl transferase family protein n=1 Tax=Streptomyces sp. NPDC019531 TaxID=3365062 RepID=UPI00384A4684
MAVTRHGRIGVDVERADRVIDPRLVTLPAFFTAAESDQLAGLPERAARARLLTLWTRKEAIGKVTGHGLSLALRGVEVSAGPSAPVALPGGGKAWLHRPVLSAPYVGALATTRPVARIVVRSAVPWLQNNWPPRGLNTGMTLG